MQVDRSSDRRVENPSIMLFIRLWKTPMAFLGFMLRPQRFSCLSMIVISVSPIGCSYIAERDTVGSVATMRVLYPWSASQLAVADAMVVFPTPPLPPKKRNFLLSTISVKLSASSGILPSKAYDVHYSFCPQLSGGDVPALSPPRWRPASPARWADRPWSKISHVVGRRPSAQMLEGHAAFDALPIISGTAPPRSLVLKEAGDIGREMARQSRPSSMTGQALIPPWPLGVVRLTAAATDRYLRWNVVHRTHDAPEITWSQIENDGEGRRNRSSLQSPLSIIIYSDTSNCGHLLYQERRMR